MKNLLEIGKITSGKIYMVDFIQGEPRSLRILAETGTHVIFVAEDLQGCEVFEKNKQDLKGIYNIKDWYEEKEAE